MCDKPDHTRATAMTRSRIFGVIGILWGGFILIRFATRGGQIEGSGAYAAGGSAAVIFGVLLLAAGIWALVSSGKRKS